MSQASLFEKPVNLEAAKTSHSEFRCVVGIQLSRADLRQDGGCFTASAVVACTQSAGCCGGRRVMREHGVKVLTVRDILSYGVEDHVGARVELEDLAMVVGGTPLL